MQPTAPLEALAETRSRLRAFVSRRAPTGTEADDIVQDVLLRLLERADEVSPAKVDAWALTAARNAIVDQVRRRRPLGLEDEGSVPSTEDKTADADLADLAGCLRPMLSTTTTAACSNESTPAVRRRLKSRGSWASRCRR